MKLFLQRKQKPKTKNWEDGADGQQGTIKEKDLSSSSSSSKGVSSSGKQKKKKKASKEPKSPPLASEDVQNPLLETAAGDPATGPPTSLQVKDPHRSATDSLPPAPTSAPDGTTGAVVGAGGRESAASPDSSSKKKKKKKSPSSSSRQQRASSEDGGNALRKRAKESLLRLMDDIHDEFTFKEDVREIRETIAEMDDSESCTGSLSGSRSGSKTPSAAGAGSRQPSKSSVAKSSGRARDHEQPPGRTSGNLPGAPKTDLLTFGLVPKPVVGPRCVTKDEGLLNSMRSWNQTIRGEISLDEGGREFHDPEDGGLKRLLRLEDVIRNSPRAQTAQRETGAAAAATPPYDLGGATPRRIVRPISVFPRKTQDEFWNVDTLMIKDRPLSQPAIVAARAGMLAIKDGGEDVPVGSLADDERGGRGRAGGTGTSSGTTPSGTGSSEQSKKGSPSREGKGVVRDTFRKPSAHLTPEERSPQTRIGGDGTVPQKGKASPRTKQQKPERRADFDEDALLEELRLDKGGDGYAKIISQVEPPRFCSGERSWGAPSASVKASARGTGVGSSPLRAATLDSARCRGTPIVDQHEKTPKHVSDVYSTPKPEIFDEKKVLYALQMDLHGLGDLLAFHDAETKQHVAKIRKEEDPRREEKSEAGKTYVPIVFFQGLFSARELHEWVSQQNGPKQGDLDREGGSWSNDSADNRRNNSCGE